MGQREFTLIGQEMREPDALARYRADALSGHVDAQVALAHCCMTGNGIKRDTVRAVRWYLHAANAGHSEAQYIVAGIYRDGVHVCGNQRIAANWYLKAIRRGHVMARFALGQIFESMAGKYVCAAHALFCLAEDVGVMPAADAREALAVLMTVEQHATARQLYVDIKAQAFEGSALDMYLGDEPSVGERAYLAGDFKAAIDPLRQEAEHGSARALLLLSLLYAQGGSGIVRDIVRSLALLEEAADKGNGEAQYMLACKYREGEDLVQSDELAQAWLLRAAEGGHAEAQCAMFRFDAMPDEYATCMNWLLKAANGGSTEAQYLMAYVYDHGVMGVEENSKDAFVWFAKAAFAGCDVAQFRLGQMYLQDIDEALAHEEAFYWHVLAAEQGHAPSQLMLGIMYCNGLHVAQSDVDALHWIRKAAEQDDEDALLCLGEMYYVGRIVPRNYRLALSLCLRAARERSLSGLYNVGVMYLHGQGCRCNPEIAYVVFTLAEKFGEADAASCIGEIRCALTIARIKELDGIAATIDTFDKLCAFIDDMNARANMNILQRLWHQFFRRGKK